MTHSDHPRLLSYGLGKFGVVKAENRVVRVGIVPVSGGTRWHEVARGSMRRHGRAMLVQSVGSVLGLFSCIQILKFGDFGVV
jgi:hypothetical protein